MKLVCDSRLISLALQNSNLSSWSKQKRKTKSSRSHTISRCEIMELDLTRYILNLSFRFERIYKKQKKNRKYNSHIRLEAI